MIWISLLSSQWNDSTIDKKNMLAMKNKAYTQSDDFYQDIFIILSDRKM